jgi:hypothetical protein
MRKEPERRSTCCASPADAARGTARARLSVLPGETAIVPVVVEKEMDLCRLCKALLEGRHLHQPGAAPRRRAEPAAHLLYRRAHRSARGPSLENEKNPWLAAAARFDEAASG